MDFSAIGSSLEAALGTQLPRILGAIAILIIGWIVAVVVRAGVRRLLGMAQLNRRIAETTEQKLDLESGIAAGAFWLIILITLIGVFNSLDLALASGPFEVLVKQIAGYMPHLVAGTVLVLVAWLAAVALRAIVNRVLDASGLDEKLSASAGMEPMRKSVGNMLFWLVILLFLPAILDAYNLGGLLDPVRAMVGKALAMLPNVFAAFVIGFVGWLLGKVLAGLVTNILAAAGADQGAHRLGLDATVRISQIVGTIVLIFVFVPALIAALDVLKIEAISRPATDMLGKLLAAVPNIVAAALILVVTYYVAKFAAGLLARLLAGIGFDSLPEKLGLASVFAGGTQPSRLVSLLVLFFAMLFATVGSGESARVHPGSRPCHAVHQVRRQRASRRRDPHHRILAGQRRPRCDQARRHHALGRPRQHRPRRHPRTGDRHGSARDGHRRRHREPRLPADLRRRCRGRGALVRPRGPRGRRKANGILAREAAEGALSCRRLEAHAGFELRAAFQPRYFFALR